MADEKDSKWQCYIIPDLATWTGAAGSKPYTPIEFYDSYEQAATRFQELRSEPYNSEDLPGARLTGGRLYPDGVPQPKPRGHEHPAADAERLGL